MASTIKVDNVQNQPGTNIVSKCGTDVTLGASGDTVALASGASQTGFGRTGTVDWITTPKVTGDSPVTGVSGNGYFMNTTAGAITINLPAGSAGDIISVADYAGTWQTNELTLSPNGADKIGGISVSVNLVTEGQSVTLVYVDSTQGWVNTMDSTSNVRGDPNLIATGGTISCSGDYKIHTFTGPGTFLVSNLSSTPANNTVSYLVVAGGGGSAASASGGGGGGGGFREYRAPVSGCYAVSPLDGNPGGTAVTVTATSYPITVSGGGAGAPFPGPPEQGCSGSVSTFSTVTSAGGGGGGAAAGTDGGSGGGGRYYNAGGCGNIPITTPAQGFDGGAGTAPGQTGNYPAGGGGGATEAGVAGGPGPNPSGRGGAGATTSISASPTAYSGGGGGGGYIPGGSLFGAASPCGTGGAGANPGTAGAINKGGGAGATVCSVSGSLGGSGVVIIRYKFQ